MSQKLTKEELDKLLKIKGMVRGAVFQTDAQYVLRHWGKKGLEKLEKRIKELGYPIDYRHSRAMSWYAVGLRTISLLLIKDTFSLSMEDIKKMGEEAPKVSFVIKILARFFVSLEKTWKEYPKYWAKNYAAGKLKMVKLDMKNHQAIVRLEGLSTHPAFCKYLTGYLMTIGSLSVKSPYVNCFETRCTFKGDPYHEYHFLWK